MRRSVVMVMAAALAATGHTASAQDVLLRIKPPQGQVTRYRMVLETFMNGGPMAQMITDTTQPLMRVTGWLTTSVTAAGGEEHTLEQVLDSAQVTSPAMPQMAAMMAQMGTMMQGITTSTRMTSRGKVTVLEMKLPSDALESARAAQGSGALGLNGGLNSGSQSSFLLLPERAVRVGSTWRDSTTVSLDSAGAVGGTATFGGTYTLKRMEGRVAVIGLDGTYGMSGGPWPAGAVFSMTTETKLDLDDGRVTGVTAEMSGTAPSAMGDIPMRMTMRMTKQ